MLNFNALPKDKPNNNTITAGTYLATIFKTQMQVSKTTGAEYLNVSFKLKDGGFVNENYFDSDKQFLQWKLGRLLQACNVTLSGEGTLKDVAKVIQGKSVIIDVAVNDRGYGSLDYSNGDGIYSTTEKTTPNETMDKDVEQAIEADISSEDF